MKQLRHYLTLVLLFICLYASATDSKDFEKHFKLMPQPQKIEFPDGKSLSPASIHSIFLQGAATRPVLSGMLATLPLGAAAAPGVLILNISF